MTGGPLAGSIYPPVESEKHMKSRIACIGMGLVLSGVPLYCFPANASAAEISFRPSLAISEEFTDNIFEVPTNKRNEFITRAQPGFTSRYQAPLWNWDLEYTFDYRNYARNSRSDEYTHNAVVRGNLSLLDNFLFIDVSDNYHRVTTDVSRNAATSGSLFINQTDQNTAVISPYLQWRLRGDNTLRTGYRYTDVRYWGEGIERREQGAFADMNHEISSNLSISAGYGFTYLESNPARYTKHDFSAGFRFEYAERSFIFGQVGNSWQQFTNGGSSSYIFWNAGVTHDFRFAVATLESRVQTAADPLAVSTKETSYSGRLEKILERGMVGLSTSYSEFEDTETGVGSRRRLTFGGTGRYEVFQSITASLAATAERFYLNTFNGFRYHLNVTSGLSYALNRDLTLSLNYTYDTQRNDLSSAVGAIDTNRVVVEMRKIF